MKKLLCATMVVLILLSHLQRTAAAENAVSAATSSVNALPQVETHDNANVRVACFSIDDTVRAVALTAAEALDADVFEVVPEQLYAEADLAYCTNGRCDQEQADASA